MTSAPCPDCSARLTGTPTCAACGLRLTGPEAIRLWDVDVALAGLATRRGELLAERLQLLAALRPGTVLASPSGATTASTPAAGDIWTSTGPTSANRQSPVQRQEWTPQKIQNTLLGLGALLLTVAGIVFAAVTYDHLGAAGRSAVLVLLTVVAGLAVPRLKTRGLDATAETVAVVTLALAALDAYGLRTLGLAADAPASLYAAGSATALAIASGLYAAVVPVRLARFAAVALPHVAVALVAAHEHLSAGSTGLTFAAIAAVDLAAWLLLQRLADVRAALVVAGGLSASFAGLTGTGGAFFDGETAGALALVCLALVSAGAGIAATGSLRLVLTSLPAPLVAVAAFAFGSHRLTEVQSPLVLAAVGLVAMQAAALLPRIHRAGPVLGALIVVAAGLATQAEALAQATLLPFGWLIEPWSRIPLRDARHSLSPYTSWDGTVVTLVVLAAAAVAVAGAGLALHRVRTAALPTAALVGVAVVVLPLGLAVSYPIAITLLLAATVALVTAGATVPRVELPALRAALTLAVLTATWSTADRDATLLVLAVLTVAFAGAAVRRPEATAVAGLAAGVFVAAAAAARGLSPDQIGTLLLVAPATLVGLTFALGGVRRVALEVAAGVLAVTAIVLTTGDVGWLSWTLALTGLLALVDASHADRRVVATAGALLLSASSWVRLADAGITAPEPYVLPLGLLALALGWLRVRREPSTRSFAAYGPGLSLLLVPSLIASFDDVRPTRALLLGGLALAVLLVGASRRLQAPIVLGGVVLAVDALQLMAPYAAALPRWMTLGAAGLLLVAVGATYEQRRRDVAVLRQRYDTLA